MSLLTLTPVSVHGSGYGSSSGLPLAITPPSSHELAVALMSPAALPS